jgi:predicted aspartyl protease
MNPVTRRAAVSFVSAAFGALSPIQVRASISFGSQGGHSPSSGSGVWHKLNLQTSRYLFVPAAIDGHTITAVVDTGATKSIIRKKLAQTLGLPVIGSVSAAAFTSEVSGSLYRIASLSVDSIAIHDVAVADYDISAVEATLSQEMPLILGLDVLSQTILEIEFPADRARFSAAVPKEILRDFSEISIARTASRLPLLEVMLEGHGPSQAIFDLGSNVLCSMSRSFAEENKLLQDRPLSNTMTAGAEGDSVSTLFNLRDLVLGGYRLQNISAVVVEDWRLSRPINLGWPLFQPFNIVLDLKQDRFYLRGDLSDLAKAYPKDRSGLGAVRLETSMVVRHVASNSPAEKVGLRAGDEIIAVDGHRVSASYPPAGERQGYKPAGTRIELTLADGRTVVLILADYF